MDKLQELFNEATDKHSRAKQQGKASGFIDGLIGFTYVGILIEGLSFICAKPDPQIHEIEEIIWPSFIILLGVGVILLLVYVYETIFAKEAKIDLDKIKNDGIKEIATTEYEKQYNVNATAGVGSAIIIFAVTFYFLWHGLLIPTDFFGYNSILFVIFRIIHISITVIFLTYFRKIDKKKGYSKEWYTEGERIRPKL